MTMNAPSEVTVDCPFCYQSFASVVDWSGGEEQVLDLDCEVCCHALVLSVRWDEDLQSTHVSTEKAF